MARFILIPRMQRGELPSPIVYFLLSEGLPFHFVLSLVPSITPSPSDGHLIHPIICFRVSRNSRNIGATFIASAALNSYRSLFSLSSSSPLSHHLKRYSEAPLDFLIYSLLIHSLRAPRCHMLFEGLLKLFRQEEF